MKEHIPEEQEVDKSSSKKPWISPELTVLDISETAGGTDALFEDDSGIAS